MDVLKAKIEELNAKLAELAEGERTIEVAKQVLALTDELKAAKAELAVHVAAEAALAEAEAEKVAEAEALAAAEAAAAEAAAAGDGDEDGGEGEDGAGDGGDGDEGDGEEAGNEEEAPVAALAASASTPSPTAHGDDVKPTLSLTASASMPGITHGQNVGRDSIRSMLNAAMRPGQSDGGGSLFRVNTHEHDAAIIKSGASAMDNTRAMNASLEKKQKPFALTAAACFCGPDDVMDGICQIGDTDRPVASLFGSSPLESTGSFRFVPGLVLADVETTDGVGIWTCDDQDLVDANDPDTWKPCAALDCFDEETVIPYFIKGCVTVEKPHQFAHPEQVDAFINMLYVDYARKAERQLLDIIEADAGAPLTVGNVGDTMEAHGLLSQLIYGMGSLEHPISYEHRSGGLENYVLLVSTGFAKALLADEHLRGFNHNKSMAELRAKIEGDYGLRLVVRKDESTARTAASLATVAALNAGGAIDTAPPTMVPVPWRSYLIDPSQWRRGEGSFVGADWVNDANLVRQNRTMFFWENIEFLVRTCPRKAYTLDLYGCINGARSDLVTPPACTD